MGKDYAVVGDGTHSLTQGEHRVPTTLTLEELENERAEYLVTFDCFSTRVTGSYYFPHVEGNEFAYLCGTQSNFTVTKPELATLLEETNASVIFNGDVYWSTELASHFVE